MPQLIGRYLRDDFRRVRSPTLRQPPTRADRGFAPVFVPMLLNLRETREFAETEGSSA
jgi:hypothetical protein